MSERGDVTVLLSSVAEGGRTALEQLLPLVHEELRQLAQGFMKLERPDHTLQATSPGRPGAHRPVA